MKKTLKVIASTAIAMSAFASVAMADDAASTTSTSTGTAATTAPATKTSADFTDLANVDAGLKAKIDALLKAGVFEGTSATTFGINENMTRAQFAKVLDLIYGVNVDMTVKTSSFSDVKADDQANGWAIPYIEAAKKAGLIDGTTDTTFNPGDNVTLGQFATALVKGLGVKPDVTGTPWYADAVKQAIAKNVLPAGTDGSAVATRADLVVGAYGGQQAYAIMNQPAQVSVVSAKATGVQTVTVTFDRDVDTSKATLSLKKGTVAVNTTTKFADDKKSATLTLTDTKLSAGDYTVTLGGLDASAIKTATGTFTAQDETVQKLDFVNASDTIALTQNATVLVKATNQYGENASFSAGSYTVVLGNGQTGQISKRDDGLLKITFDDRYTDSAQKNASSPNLTVIPVNIWFNDTHVSASKNFTVGVAPFITKMDVGTVNYSNGNGNISKTGETATFALHVYDQYGNDLGFKAIQNILYPNGGAKADLIADQKAQAVFTPYEQLLSAGLQDYDNNDTPEVRVSISKNIEKSGDYTVQVYMQGATATQKVSLTSTAVAEKVAIGDFNGVIAAGDTDVYIPIIAYDANGNQLSTSDLTSDQNVGRINVQVSGATAADANGNPTGSTATILQSGDHKGYIRLGTVPTGHNSLVTVTATIATANASSTATKSYTVGNARIPDHLKVVNEPAKQIVPGASSKFTIQVIDQYGASMDKAYLTDGSGNVVTNDGSAPTPASGQVYYYAAATETGTSYANGSVQFIAQDGNQDTSHPFAGAAGADTFNTLASKTVTGSTYALQNTDFDLMNNDYDFVTKAGASGQMSFTLTLYKQVVGSQPVPIDSVTRNLTVSQSTDSLTYSINTVPGLFNAIDSGLVTDQVYHAINGEPTWTALSAKDQELDTASVQAGTVSKFAQEVTISAKNAAGDSVAFPKQITAITTSNATVAKVVYNAGHAYVLGDKAGTATIAVSFTDAKNNIQTLNAPVTVKSDVLTVDHITAGNSSKTVSLSNTSANGVNANAWDAMDLQVYDNYGVKYEEQAAYQYNYLMGVTFSVTNVKGGTASVDQYGNITASGAGVSFDLTATSANGKTAVTSITTAN